MASSLMEATEIAEELHLSRKYVQNHWKDILPGIKPRKTRKEQRKLLFNRDEVRGLLLQSK